MIDSLPVFSFPPNLFLSLQSLIGRWIDVSDVLKFNPLLLAERVAAVRRTGCGCKPYGLCLQAVRVMRVKRTSSAGKAYVVV